MFFIKQESIFFKYKKKIKIIYTTKKRPDFPGRFILFNCLKDKLNYPFKLAARYSRFIRAIFSREIPFGHSTSQAPVLVQLPKPSKSIW